MITQISINHLKNRQYSNAELGSASICRTLYRFRNPEYNIGAGKFGMTIVI
jgi:hypothetical protein